MYQINSKTSNIINLNRPIMKKFLLLCTLCGLFSVGYTNINSEQQTSEYEPKTEAENIVFADAVVKAVCVSAFDTNGDGELSYEEAAKVTSIPSDFFGENKGKVSTFNELKYFTNLQLIKDRAFAGSGLSQIIIPEGVTHIGYKAFQYTNIASIVIPNSVKTMGDVTFFCCLNLHDVTLSKNLTSIPNCAFEFTNLQCIIIPDSVKSINDRAFANCNALIEVTIPSSVVAIGPEAFGRCQNLRAIYCKSVTPPALDNEYESNYNCTMSNDTGILGRAKKYFKIYVPKESVKAYKKDRKWKHYSKNIEGYDFK